MNNKKEKKLTLVRIGILLGVSLTALAIASDLIWSNLSFSMSNIIFIFSSGPLHWIIVTSPFFLGLVFYYFKRVVERREKILSDERNKKQEELVELEQFITDIERGDFSGKEHVFQNQHIDYLLQSLKKTLISKKEEDEKARWVTEGHAKFGEIFRMTNDLVKLSEEVIRNLVKYVGLSQGSVFIIDQKEEETALELTSNYAYDRQKNISKTIIPGEGQVGQCFLDGETILLQQVPQNYIRINSGLGGATPNFIIIVPIKANDEAEGVMELAGFSSLPEYRIKFIEKVCEDFASVIRTVKVNNETKALLTETQSQTEQLQAQEEEIRQHMEEMHATQEELSRQLEESKILAERVERREQVMALTTILSETDLNGTITFVNEKFCEVSKYDREELIGQPQNIVRHPDMPKELFRLFWKTIKQGDVFRGIVKNSAKDGAHYWVDVTIVPIKNKDGKIIKYTGSRYHIEDEELAVKLYNKQADYFGWAKLAPELLEFAG
jgi:PAS domain S-box-containing protein